MKKLIILVLASLNIAVGTAQKIDGSSMLRILNEKKASLLVYNNDSLSSYHKNGVHDLLELVQNEPARLKGAMVADKIIGKASASLIVLGGVKEVHTNTICTPAKEMLQKAGVKLSFTDEVPYIINRTKTGQCPLDSTLGNVTVPAECLPLIANFYKPASTVYFTKEITPESLVRIFKALNVDIPKNARVAVKISTGESQKTYHLRPDFIAPILAETKGRIVECNTAYGGSRSNTADHRRAIEQRGYVNVDIMDEEDTIHIPVKDAKWIKYDIVGSHLKNYDFMVNLAHFKGHQMGGFGGVLKNQSIGVASSSGKAYIHSAGVTQEVERLWGHVGNQDGFLESMAAAAQAVHNHFKKDGRNIVYINVMNNMSIDCDCNAHPAAPMLKDMGILASTDPVALDRACLDLVFGHTNTTGDTADPLIARIKQKHGTHTVEYAEQIGLGSQKYKIVDIDK